jgi:hypothetical protein
MAKYLAKYEVVNNRGMKKEGYKLENYIFERIENGPKVAGGGGGTWTFGFLGPDVFTFPRPGHNEPTNKDDRWWKNILKDHTIDQWIQGHLMNGKWAGKGDIWENLVPLTNTTNGYMSDYAEHYVHDYLEASARIEKAANPDNPFERDGYQRNPKSFIKELDKFPYWLGVLYRVIRSIEPYSDKGKFKHAPKFVFLSLKLVRVPKPHRDSGMFDGLIVPESLYAEIESDDIIIPNLSPLTELPENNPLVHLWTKEALPQNIHWDERLVKLSKMYKFEQSRAADIKNGTRRDITFSNGGPIAQDSQDEEKESQDTEMSE